MNLLSNIDCIYYCSCEQSNNTYIKNELSKFNISFNTIKNITYNYDKSFDILPYFKKSSIIDICKDALNNNYNYICIFSDNINITSLEISSLPEYISILNTGDINEDCYILSNKTIKSIINNNYNLNDEIWLDKFNKDFNSFNKIYENICFHKIDYVITFVDNNDPIWQSEYSKFSNNINNNSYQYRDFGLLKYNILGVLKNIPWINNIYLIVSSDSQVPEYINRNKVKIILHKDIIPEHFLPTFNSTTIEMFIPKINGLSEYFIYGNDDMLILKSLDKPVFFKEGKIGLIMMNNPEYVQNEYAIRCRNSFSLTVDEFSKNHFKKLKLKDEYKRLKHTPHPYLKSSCYHILSYYKDKIYNSISNIRNKKNYNQYVFGLYDYLVGNYYEPQIKQSCEKILLYKKLLINNYQILCLNDNNILSDSQFNELKNYVNNDLNKIFNVNQKCVKLNTNKIIDKITSSQTNKKVIYTCITGNYDDLIEPYYISPGFDYICFTDNKNLKSNVWKFKSIPQELHNLSFVKQQRNIKINAHLYLSEYDLSIWVDSSVELKSNINIFLNKINLDKYNLFVTTHPQRNNVKSEAEACLRLKKDTIENIEPLLKFYNRCGFEDNYGLGETNVLIRKHNEKTCIELMEVWWDILNKYSHRDQLSFTYSLWKLKYKNHYYLPVGTNHTNYFNWLSGKHKFINICIIHYNTPILTDCLIKSINKYNKRTKIYLFDNSDKKPFTNKYDNLIYIDNTKGNYINFEEWLNKYPTRLLSKEKTQSYGSAKHSISVQKCMELIDDNFILMDSDILLKQSVDNFINSKMIYVGMSERQNNGIYRVLPYILYINTELCKKYNISWFDEKYMHGLHITKESDRYDTGGAFYVHTRKYNSRIKEIDINKYIVHYKGGSWEDIHNEYKKRYLTSEEWLEKNKKYWE